MGLIEKLDISYLHVFSYSGRENTLASKMTGLVQDRIKKQRSDILHDLSHKKKQTFYKKNQGYEANVLFESANSDGYMHGFTGNYVRVSTPYRTELVNQIKRVKLEHLGEHLEYIVNMEEPL